LEVISTCHNVTVFPKTYRGKTPAPKYERQIETPYYEKREEAEQALQFIAAINSCDTVQRVEYISEIREVGNYKHSVWKATGLI